MTLSFGGADLTVADHEKMLAEADTRLYKARHAGKNRVVV